MDLRRALLHSPHQGHQGRLLFQAPAEAPAPDRAAEEIHQDGEMDELLLESHARDVRDSDLTGSNRLRGLDRVRGTGEAINAVGRPGMPRRRLAREDFDPERGLAEHPLRFGDAGLVAVASLIGLEQRAGTLEGVGLARARADWGRGRVCGTPRPGTAAGRSGRRGRPWP